MEKKKVIEHPAVIDDAHPTVKPLPIIKRLLINCSEENDLILDPFLGSGTTGVACAEMGRKFTGIELDEKYFDIACRRIENAYKQPDLFL
jgi:site-specific DNA-methyltransferase (adenine-specific)